MKILKFSDEQFDNLQKFVEKECDYVSEIASEYIDSEIGNELIEDNKPLFDLQQKLNDAVEDSTND
jgi:hypothetical protein|tara:strand:- start:24 stop:221 length:198 start_codon:yes stop_codon:yes gene_type:complete